MVSDCQSLLENTLTPTRPRKRLALGLFTWRGVQADLFAGLIHSPVKRQGKALLLPQEPSLF
jgi:hypothetical protein